jgi:dTDP-L-rhamnose 4-epimerase
MEDPLRYVQQNSLDTAKFLLRLEHVHRNNPKPRRLVVASSMSVYGEGEDVSYEFDAVAPESVYALTKYDQEQLCLMWGRKLKLPTVALRFFNIYGPGQALTNPYTGVLANFARLIMAGERPIVFEDGQQTRDFIHVKDVARAVVRAASHTEPEGIFNVCTGVPTTIEHAARTLAAALGSDLEPYINGRIRPGDIRHCVGDPTKAAHQLGFTAEIPFEEGIKEYGAWLTAHQSPS